MRDLDKDIEFLKEKIEECTRIIQSVSNMENKKTYSKERTNFKKVLNLIENKDKELETWKKIAEKLAEHIDFCPNNFEITKCEDYDNNCAKCRLEYVRKEVENES